MAYGHMNPDESLQALADLGSPVMVAIHFGTIQLADNGYDQPLKDLERAMRIRGVLQSRVHVLMPGQHNLFVSERKKHK
jgi:L-ascorbate metabolism protein UlaG (beta-lactamase superfamily)